MIIVPRAARKSRPRAQSSSHAHGGHRRAQRSRPRRPRRATVGASEGDGDDARGAKREEHCEARAQKEAQGALQLAGFLAARPLDGAVVEDRVGPALFPV